MNMLINSVQLIGRLGADAEVKSTNNGTKVSNVRFATNEYSKNAQGEWLEITYWHNLVFWGKLTEKLEKHAKKGTRLLVQGSLTYQEYVDVNGIKRESCEIRVSQFMTLNSSSNNGQKVSLEDSGYQEEDLPF